MMIRCAMVFSFLMLSVAVTCGADWSQWRGPQRDGKAVGESIRHDWNAHPPELLWQMEGLGKGFGSLSIVGNKLFATGNMDDGQAVVAVDLDSHKVIWTTVISTGGTRSYPGSRCTPTYSDGALYVTSNDGVLCALSADDGKIIWKRDFPSEFGSPTQKWGFAESPLVDGDRVIATPGAGNAVMAAFDKETGETIWQTPYPDLGGPGKQEPGYSSIVITNAAGVKQYVQNTGQGVIGVRASDGKYLWGNSAAANRVAVIPTPLVQGDYVFATSSYKTGSVLLKLSPGMQRGTVNAEQVYFLDGKKVFENHHGQMILHNGYIYGGHGQNKGFPMCIEFLTGEVAWGGEEDKLRGPSGSKGSAAVIFADGYMIWRYQNGLIALIEATPKEYREKGTFTPPVVEEPSWSHPVIVDGQMYLREQNSLMCFDVSQP
ncbi:PQQ-binding-like beta-propeller repeat protein [Calycomorphotria hydatis]|uniref:Outer membrane biogenesis protein BamB n=1 Tax=Calycomorphotria hydatis TaxID=2528027 RepID=A0A517T736_9PLAN|nr:PQQ-binding-like beta-propeller repeat protein [Calycomorphotria hydatis]QDT64177.1 outer membrane biogenesis protein BamB [Calycomorphotria hydatis]